MKTKFDSFLEVLIKARKTQDLSPITYSETKMYSDLMGTNPAIGDLEERYDSLRETYDSIDKDDNSISTSFLVGRLVALETLFRYYETFGDDMFADPAEEI